VSTTLSDTLQPTAGLHTPHGPGNIRRTPIIHDKVGNPSEQNWGEPRERGHSFNSTLEVLSRERFTTKTQARREVAGFIDRYNNQRRHSTCEMMAPVAYEQALADRKTNQAMRTA
jgi:transposase InsO family protein